MHVCNLVQFVQNQTAVAKICQNFNKFIESSCSYSKSQNSSMTWVGRNLKDDLVLTPLPWTRTPSTGPGCSDFADEASRAQFYGKHGSPQFSGLRARKMMSPFSPLCSCYSGKTRVKGKNLANSSVSCPWQTCARRSTQSLSKMKN